MLVKVALRREQDGTPTGHPAPTFFQCPCGKHVPVYDRKGARVSGHGHEPLVCECGQKFHIDGYLIPSITWKPTTEAR